MVDGSQGPSLIYASSQLTETLHYGRSPDLGPECGAGRQDGSAQVPRDITVLPEDIRQMCEWVEHGGWSGTKTVRDRCGSIYREVGESGEAGNGAAFVPSRGNGARLNEFRYEHLSPQNCRKRR